MTRAQEVAALARRILDSPNPPRAVAEMLANHDLIVAELTRRIEHLEAILATTKTEPEFPRQATGRTRKRATDREYEKREHGRPTRHSGSRDGAK